MHRQQLRKTIPLMLLIAAIVVGIGIYLVPNKREVALMQMDDSNFNTAFKRYSALEEEGDRTGTHPPP